MAGFDLNNGVLPILFFFCQLIDRISAGSFSQKAMQAAGDSQRQQQETQEEIPKVFNCLKLYLDGKTCFCYQKVLTSNDMKHVNTDVIFSQNLKPTTSVTTNIYQSTIWKRLQRSRTSNLTCVGTCDVPTRNLHGSTSSSLNICLAHRPALTILC